MESEQTAPISWLDRPVFSFLPKLNIETLLVIVILILAVLSRFVNLGARVMSHDEVNHVVPAYSLYHGQGYAYDPVTHGPLQFHMMALSYFLLGDSDFSSRAPDALVGVITIAAVLFLYRRYLGRIGALIAGFLYLISPFMLFYDRYTRNEVYGGLWTVLIIYGALRYLEKGERLSLYLLTVVMALHFTDKATAYIYNAQLLIFLGVLFLISVIRLPWPADGRRWLFAFLMGIAFVLIIAVVGYAGLTASQAAAAAPGANPEAPGPLTFQKFVEIGIVAIALLSILAAFILLVRNLGWKVIRAQRTFDLIMLAGTLTLPLLAAFPVRMLGWDPLDYSSIGMLRSGIFLILFSVTAVVLGLWWKPRFWIGAAAIFYAIFTIFFTTFFTNGKGFFMGLMASLGYWLSQQGVQRGSQPLYYYALIQIPIYEYLAALGTLLAFVLAFRHRLFYQFGGYAPAAQPEIPPEAEASPEEEESLIGLIKGVFVKNTPVPDEMEPPLVEAEVLPVEAAIEPAESAEDQLPNIALEPIPGTKIAPKAPVMALLLYWALTSLAAYSVAGERMPWLTVHIAGAMLLSSGWAIGYLIDTTPWRKLANRTGIITILLIPIILTSLFGTVGAWLGATPPFQGNTVTQLEATSTFFVSLVVLILATFGFLRLLKDWEFRNLIRLYVLGFFGLCAVLTARTAYTASFINYDYATEFLVYAHGAPGPKQVLAQLEEISQRTTKGKDLVVAYDNETNYPYWWYLRDWPNKKYYGDTPGRDIRDAAVIVVGDPNYAKVEPIVKSDYTMFEYTRLWWPMQDYFDLTPERIWYAISNSEMRQAIFNIWLNRDYTLYAQATSEKTLTLTAWSPAARMRMYIRNDILAQMWNYGAAPSTTPPTQTDPYDAGLLKLTPDLVVSGVGTGAQASNFNAPRGLSFAPDGTVYVADSRNNRILHLSADLKTVINQWGTFADVLKGAAPEGTFNEPWDVAVGPDGSVYVADTFNFRIQKFTADGKFVKMWGYFGQAEKPEAFWGPRGLAFDSKGRLFVTDTGNKRVVVFTANGDPVTSFGTSGFDPGQFDEPVGIAIDKQDNVYIADTWNQRIQVLAPDSTGNNYLPLRNWDVSAWFGQSLDNKPYIALDSSNNVYITDPEGQRVLIFSSDGKYLRGISATSADGGVNFALPAGIAIDSQDRVYVTDGSGNSLMRFTVPTTTSISPAQPSPTQPLPTATQ
jgi:predicted membrane-bound mannosyltransferase/sugar lactone lactonase YvrE